MIFREWPFRIPPKLEAAANRLDRAFPNVSELLPQGSRGKVEIRHNEVDENRAYINRCIRNEVWTPRVHCQLDIDGVGWMFDTVHEKWLNRWVLRHSRGKVLLGGLGIGMILWPLLRKSTIERIDVIEMSEDVIELVLPSLRSHPQFSKLRILHGDARVFTTSDRYDYIWLDCVPAYGYGTQFVEIHEGWMKRFEAFAVPGAQIDHWGYWENVEWLLGKAYEKEECEPSLFMEEFPIGPTCADISTMITMNHPELFRKLLGGTDDPEDALGICRL